MKCLDRERVLGLQMATVAAEMMLCLLVGCASSPKDAGAAGGFCTGPASGELIDDMSGSSISLQPPPCGTKGTWYAFSTGTLTVPTVDPSIASNCGSDCQSLYSPLPSEFPGSTATGDGGGTPGGKAMCIAGQTGMGQNNAAAMQLVLAWSGGRNSTDPPQALIDASDYAGIQFWLWVPPDTAASVSANLLVGVADKNLLPGGGVCNVNDTGTKACGLAAAAVSSSMAQAHGSGRLLADDGSTLGVLSGGWQHVWAPWSSFTTNPNWGGANEQTVDPSTLWWVALWVEHDSTSAPGVPFDFCIYQLSFLSKSDVPVPPDGGP